jgi:hypothetical protein
MTVDFSWRGIPACQSTLSSPAFLVKNAPEKTHQLQFILQKQDDQREYGGATVPYPVSGVVPRGLITTNGPCHPGPYQWTVTALDALGNVLATAQKVERFPN